MTLWDRITAYQPGDETEAADKASFLQFLAAFGDKVYQRENLVGHVTATAWIANKAHDKVLMCFHNIYQALGLCREAMLTEIQIWCKWFLKKLVKKLV